MITIYDNITHEKIPIKKYMAEQNYSLYYLSLKSNIGIFELAYLIFVPFSRIKLTQAILVSRALKINISDLN